MGVGFLAAKGSEQNCLPILPREMLFFLSNIPHTLKLLAGIFSEWKRCLLR